MAGDDRTDRFRAVFEPEDIFDRFVKNANASTEVPIRRDDEPTGQVRNGKIVTPNRGGPPSWDHEITVKAASIADGEPEDDPPFAVAPMVPPFSSASTQLKGHPHELEDDDEDDYDEDEELLTLPRASPLMTDSGSHILLLTKRKPLSSATAAPTMQSVTVPAESALPRAAFRSVSAPLDAPPSQDDETSPVMELGEPDSDATLPLDSVETMLRETRDDLPTRVASHPELERRSASIEVRLDSDEITADGEAPQPQTTQQEWQSVVAEQGEHTQRAEAAKFVPDVSAIANRQEVTYVGEGVEAGQMPTRQLDQILSDMAVLLRYGHANQVRERLDDLRRVYPEDLLLLRAIAEFHVEHEDDEAALEVLFVLASALFERRNLEGMRQALEQVLVLDPDNVRAYRLLGLLEKRA